jgi:hypothetical protein
VKQIAPDETRSGVLFTVYLNFTVRVHFSDTFAQSNFSVQFAFEGTTVIPPSILHDVDLMIIASRPALTGHQGRNTPFVEAEGDALRPGAMLSRLA